MRLTKSINGRAILNPEAFPEYAQETPEREMRAFAPFKAVVRAVMDKQLRHNNNWRESDISGTVTTGFEHIRGGTKLVVQCVLKWIVRRLTPLECERLQGYPDYWTCLPKIEYISDDDFEFWKGVIKTHKAINGKKSVIPSTKEKMIKWYNKLETDGSRYKALGNSLAIPNALRVIKGIADYVKEVSNE